MSDPVLALDEALRAPLAAFAGEQPPAPSWFEAAIAQAPERSTLEVEGATIETLAWGERGRPGLLFLHGGMANADWWAHIAPFFSKTHRVAALSLSGMGRSSWRERYDVGQYAREMVTAAEACALYEDGPPVFVGHSFGSRPLLNAASDPDVALRAAVIVDAAVSPPKAPEHPLPEPRPRRVYPDLTSALTRFRLAPYQECENTFILDYIARQSLAPAPLPGGGEGWTWRFDPYGFKHLSGMRRTTADAALRAVHCPLAFVVGEKSAIVRPDNLAYSQSIAPKGTLFTITPDAAHHVFLDQPLAFVATLRTLLAGWGA